MLLLLEGCGGVERRANTDQDRAGIGRQPARDVIRKFGEVKALVGHDGGHSRAAVSAGNFHAIGGRIDNTGAVRNRLVHFGRVDVLAFPAESISDPIDKVEKAAFIEPHQIAGTKPGIAFREYIAQDLLFGLARIGIALEAASALIGRADPADGLAGFAITATNAKTIRVANGEARI